MSEKEQLYAFQSWGIGLGFQMSKLYVGQEALDFIESHYESGTYATLHEGGEEVAELYDRMETELYAR